MKIFKAMQILLKILEKNFPKKLLYEIIMQYIIETGYEAFAQIESDEFSNYLTSLNILPYFHPLWAESWADKGSLSAIQSP